MKLRNALSNLYRNITGKNYYNKIYHPFYNNAVPLSSDYPEVYNKYGQKMEFFFLRDYITAHVPYLWKSNFFIWDRYNFELKTQFYSHNSMLETMGNPDRRFGMLIESESIVPEDYKIFQKYKGLEKDFDLILTYSDKILNTVSNARFVPFCAQVWYGFPQGGGEISDETYKKKTKNISIVSSNKTLCELHIKRLSLAKELQQNNKADAFGNFDGGKVVKIADTLTNYRYSICIENYISDYFFTERITNCFASMTVPIYYGANKISQFFNEDGIIILNSSDLNNIDNILSKCNEMDYEQRLPAIIDNFNRVKKYFNIDDYLYKIINNIKLD